MDQPLDENGKPEVQVPDYLDVSLEEYKKLMEEMNRELFPVPDEEDGDEGVLRGNGRLPQSSRAD